jgi:hypothetical protein
MTVRLRRLLLPVALVAASVSTALVVCAAGAAGLAEGLQGSVGGSLNVAVLSELGLRWRLEAGAVHGLLLKADAEGVRLIVEAVSAGRAEWRWRIVEGSVELDGLWPVLKSALGAKSGDWRVGGKAALSGGGVWTPSGGLAGSVRLELREAWASSAELALELGGIEADFYCDDPAAGVLPLGQSLRVARFTAGAVTAERLECRFGINAARVLELAFAELDVLGGRARLKPMVIPLNSTRALAGAEVEGLALSELAKLMPDAISGARGKLSGQVQLLWDVEAGVRINDGGLAIVRSDDAVLRLAPMPGFLTGNLPARFTFLPAWLGPLARWTAPENPAYAPLKDIEMGRSGLRIDTLAVKFYPETAGGERTATVRLTARPVGADLIEQVTIEVNLAGALARVLELGMDKRVKLRFRGE